MQNMLKNSDGKSLNNANNSQRLCNDDYCLRFISILLSGEIYEHPDRHTIKKRITDRYLYTTLKD